MWRLKLYGAIPIIKENLPVYTNINEVQVYREPTDEVFEYIIELIDEAILNLPDVVESEAQELGRITKPIALSIKARVLVTAASPLFNGNTDFATLKDNRGINLFSQTYDQNKWVKALEATKEAIDACEAVGMVLVNDYKTRTLISEQMERECILRSIFTERKSPEVIWGATHSTFATRYQRLCVPLLLAVTSSNPVSQNYAPTLRMAELYYSKNGVPINEDKFFDYENRFELRTSTSSETDYVRSGQKTVGLHFDREPRFYANIAFDRGVYFLEPNYYFVQTRAGELATKRNQGQYSATGYFMKKFINPNSGLNTSAYTTYYEFPFPVMRLADLYLLYAEALNEVKDVPDDEVYLYIDKVRERAGLEGIKDSWTNYSSNSDKYKTKAGMREIIHHERLIELAFEGQRFWDIRRWKTAHKYHSKPIQGWNIQGRDTEFYNVKTIYFPSFEFRDYLWPIKEEELIKNPNLVQNPGW